MGIPRSVSTLWLLLASAACGGPAQSVPAAASTAPAPAAAAAASTAPARRGPAAAPAAGKASGPPHSSLPVYSGPDACTRDEECTLTEFDCSPCGRCPGEPPYAMHRAALERAEKACALNRKPSRRGPPGPRPPPMCGRCPDVDLERLRSPRTAVCERGRCQSSYAGP